MAVTTLVCLFLGLALRIKTAYRLWAVVCSKVCGRELEITGANPDPAARLIIANHVSYLDPIPIYYLWPTSCPVAMQRIRSWFLIGYLLRDSLIFVDPTDGHSRRQAREQMRRIWDAGGTVLVFPEGRASHGSPPSASARSWTRSRTAPRPRESGSFRLGPFEEAVAGGITTQGVRISYPPELLAALDGRWFEERFFWILCQNFKIRAHVFPAEPAASDAETLRSTWEARLLSHNDVSMAESPRIGNKTAGS